MGLGSPVSAFYADKRPFAFERKFRVVQVTQYKKGQQLPSCADARSNLAPRRQQRRPQRLQLFAGQERREVRLQETKSIPIPLAGSCAHQTPVQAALSSRHPTIQHLLTIMFSEWSYVRGANWCHPAARVAFVQRKLSLSNRFLGGLRVPAVAGYGTDDTWGPRLSVSRHAARRSRSAPRHL
jgi:hypothetical protein